MVNNRLMWVLESKGLLASEQCGFRKNRSTADHLVRFDSYIRNAFAKKEHVLAIFFDLEKAYDTTWKHDILSDLYDLDFRGHLPTFIDGFLSHRLFQVRLGPLCLIRKSTRWVFPKVASCLRFFSVLKLTILQSQPSRFRSVIVRGRSRPLYTSKVPPTCTETYATVCKQCAGMGL